MSRDYKHRSRRRHDSAPGWVWMLFGLALGLSISLYTYLGRAPERAGPKPQLSEPASARAEAAGVERTGDEVGGRRYDFYDMLPNFEVVIPEREPEVAPDVRPSAVERPGTYVLQAGSFKNLADADRMRATLAIQGVPSRIQRVSIDNDTWHRVRIGPIDDLDELNRMRQRLRGAGIDVLMIRVGD